MKTKAFGIDTSYSSKDIDNPEKLAEMCKQQLFDDDDHEVEPVRTSIDGKAAHFRNTASVKTGERIGRSENDPTHDQAIDLIKAKLSSNDGKFAVTTHSPYEREVVIVKGEQKKVMKSVPIFESLPISKYLWFKECDARIWLDQKRYIQPDLVGCNSMKSGPSPSALEIVIEVIRTHPPCEDTYEVLRNRSRGNCLVLFYFVAPTTLNSDANSIKSCSGKTYIRANYYLRNGILHYRLLPAELSTNLDASASEQYAYIRKKHFDNAMRDVFREKLKSQS